jgi:hypothetical protein
MITKRTPEEIREAEEKRMRAQLIAEFRAAWLATVPTKYQDVNPWHIQPSTKSRLPLEDQAKLYKDIQDHPLEGWAFFAPAGYSKTTCSWALYRYALGMNLKRAIYTGKEEWIRVAHMESRPVRYWTPCYIWQTAVPEWLERIQASWDEDSKVTPPALSFDKIEKARRDGFTPRVFLEEIDKIKEGSEWNTNKLFTLINAIDKHKGQLVLDTNLSRRQFMNRFGEAIYRRVKENCNMREFGFNETP